MTSLARNVNFAGSMISLHSGYGDGVIGTSIGKSATCIQAVSFLLRYHLLSFDRLCDTGLSHAQPGSELKSALGFLRQSVLGVAKSIFVALQ